MFPFSRTILPSAVWPMTTNYWSSFMKAEANCVPYVWEGGWQGRKVSLILTQYLWFFSMTVTCVIYCWIKLYCMDVLWSNKLFASWQFHFLLLVMMNKVSNIIHIISFCVETCRCVADFKAGQVYVSLKILLDFLSRSLWYFEFYQQFLKLWFHFIFASFSQIVSFLLNVSEPF